MRIKLFLLSAVAMLMLASCSKDSADLTCKGVDHTGAELVSVEDVPFTLSKTDAENTSELNIKVDFKLKKNLSGIAGLDDENIELEKDVKLVVYSEKKGILISLELKGDSAIHDFKALLKGKVGDTKSIAFSKNVSKEVAKDVVNDASYFKIDAIQIGLKNINLSGAIGGKYGAKMTLNIDGYNKLTGAYYYDRMGPSNVLYLVGEVKEDGSAHIEEYTVTGDNSATIEATFVGDKLTGSFFNNNHAKVYDFEFKPYADMDPIPYRDVTPSTSSSFSSGLSTGGGSGIGALLDEYEAFVDNMVSFYQKLDQDDPTALMEYAKMTQKALSLSQKLEDEKGEMTMDDVQRLLEIQQKMNSAMTDTSF